MMCRYDGFGIEEYRFVDLATLEGGITLLFPIHASVDLRSIILGVLLFLCGLLMEEPAASVSEMWLW